MWAFKQQYYQWEKHTGWNRTAWSCLFSEKSEMINLSKKGKDGMKNTYLIGPEDKR